MPQFFMNKRLIILLVSIIILVALIGFSLSRSKLTWPEQFIKDTTGWVQTLVSRPVHYVAGVIDNVKDLQDTYQENKELKAKIEEYGLLKAQVQGLQKDNEELQKIVDEYPSLNDKKLLKATIVSRDPNQWNELITINRGKNDGVEKDMAVITSAGLIGKVKSVSTGTSTVQLLSSEDPTNRISAYIQKDENNKKKNKKTSVFGLIEDYDKESKNLIMTWEEVPDGLEVKKGQIVSTSGLGGVFPPDLAIGKVVKVESDEYGLAKKAYIEPAADFYDIEHVLIVKRESGEGDE